jgi:transposase-like protein
LKSKSEKLSKLLATSPILLILVMRYAWFERFSIKNGELIFLILVAIIFFLAYRLFKKIYTNLSKFFILSFLLIGAFPYLHYLIYHSDKNNYTFNSDYLNQRILGYKENLKNYSDSTFIEQMFKNFKNSNISLATSVSAINKNQNFGNYVFILKTVKQDWYHIGGAPIPRGISFGRNNLFEVSDGKNKFFFNTKGGNLKDEIILYLKEKQLLQTQISNPKQFVPFSDIWLDSVTGFVFAFIKPLSTKSQILRLFQIITAYFFFYMVSSWLKQSKILDIDNVKKKK